MLVSDFISAIRVSLFDPTPGAGWTDDELLGYLNEAVRATCFVKPDAYSVAAPVALVAGIVQTIPAGGTAILDVMFNTVSGRAITQVDKALMEAADPGWAAEDGVTDIEHYTADPRSPLRFYVYPPASLSASVMLLYGAAPPTPALDSTIALTDTYVPALEEYVQSRAFTKSSQRANPTKSATHKQNWGQMLGLKSQAQVIQSPKIADGTPT